MTTNEFREEFDILYNTIAAEDARDLDDYEISVFLTQAQEELVKWYVHPKKNALYEGFEMSEEKRRYLDSLVNNQISTTYFISAGDAIDGNSLFFVIDNNTWYITYEKIKVKSSITSVNGKFVRVIPITQDDYHYNSDNPFKKPDCKTAWRMDYKKINNQKVVEIIPSHEYQPIEYIYRYVKKPEPIILSNLTTLGPNLTIDGLNVQNECKLSSIVHRDILRYAVFLALKTTGNPRAGLESNIDNFKE